MADRLLKSIVFPDLDDTYIIGDTSLSVAGAGADAKATGDALATKANTDGLYEDMTVGNAEQLVSTVRVNDQSPYLFRTSGGSVDIGDREYINAVVGSTIAWNQQVIETTETDHNITRSIVNGKVNLNGTANGAASVGYINPLNVPSHKILVLSAGTSHEHVRYFFRDVTNSSNIRLVNYSTDVGDFIFAVPATCAQLAIYSIVDNTTQLENFQFRFQVFDLTQMFGSTIADYIYSLETATAGAGVAWFKKLFQKPYYAYNAGELKSVSGLVSHDMTGFNQLGGSFVSGKKWNSGTYEDGSTNQAANSFKAKCLPNTQYCFCMPQITSNIGYYRTYFDADGTFITKTSADGINSTAKTGLFTTPSNAYYVAIDLYRSGGFAATELEEACLNIAWDNSRNGEYEPYELHSYPLDSDLTLRGIPKLDAYNSLYYDGDTYEADGTVTRKYKYITGAEMTLHNTSSSGYKTYKIVADDAKNSGAILTNYTANRQNSVNSSTVDEEFYQYKTTGTHLLFFVINPTRDINSVSVIYELATPTTESADPYQTPQVVSDWGTEEYVIANSVTVPIPVGHNTDYTPNLVAKLEMAPNSPEGNGDYIVRQTDGVNAYVPLVIEDALPTIPSTAGTYTLTVTVADGEDPVLSWEA